MEDPLTRVNILFTLFPNVPKEVSDTSELDPNVYYVYMLFSGDNAVVVGHGKMDRVRVIFDDARGHVKAFLVRVMTLYGTDLLTRIVIPCKDKAEAAALEHRCHKSFGGNTLRVPAELERKLYAGLVKGSEEYRTLRLAQLSRYAGLSDLYHWQRNGEVSDRAWEVIKARLNL